MMRSNGLFVLCSLAILAFILLLPACTLVVANNNKLSVPVNIPMQLPHEIQSSPCG